MKVLKVYQGTEEDLKAFARKQQVNFDSLKDKYSNKKITSLIIHGDDIPKSFLKIKKQNNFGKIEWRQAAGFEDSTVIETFRNLYIHILDESREKLNENFLESLS